MTDYFLAPYPTLQVVAFLYTLNKSFRDLLERKHAVTDIFVANNDLHGRPGIGFFLWLDNDTIFHGSCGCGNVKREHYKP